jgi:PTH1 family peptidyl-tRNA hydrolase
MKLIVGLGNPGKAYAKTRHNAGFLAVEELSDWKFEKKFNAEIAEVKIGKERVIFAKPQTFMNKSGDAAGKLARFYKVKPHEVWVIHDDLDLPLGTLRIKQGGSSAGHKGMQSVIESVGEDCVRFRIGIAKSGKRPLAETFVLQKFTAADLEKLEAVFSRVAEAIPVAIHDGLPKAMSIYNR